jgi:hypothetical protein
MKAGTQNHMKTKRLKRLLGLPLYRVVGLLETLWLLCVDCADEGNVGKFSDEEIADYLEWDGPQSPSDLVRALTDSGWLDADAEHRLVVHDWADHAPEFLKERVRKRHAREAKRRKQTTYDDSTRDSGGTKPDSGGTKPDASGPTRDQPPLVPSIPNQSQPIPTQPIPTTTTGDAGRGWVVVEERLRGLGVREAETATTAAREHGCTVDQVQRLADHWERHRTREGWGVGLLHHAAERLQPGDAPQAILPACEPPRNAPAVANTLDPESQAMKRMARWWRQGVRNVDAMRRRLADEGLPADAPLPVIITDALRELDREEAAAC